MRMLHLTVLLAGWVTVRSLAAEGADAPFDPRQVPDTKTVIGAIKEVERAWRKAGLETKKQLLSQLEAYDHPRSAQAIVALVKKKEVAELVLDAIARLRSFKEAFVAQALPDLLEAREGELPLWEECLRLACEKRVYECLPAIRKAATPKLPPGSGFGSATAEDRAALHRKRAIEALGNLPHEESLDTVVTIMESYAPLENEEVPHGSAGSDMSWSMFYVPARTAFARISGSEANTAIDCRSWMAKHADFKVKREPRDGEDYLKESKPKKK